MPCAAPLWEKEAACDLEPIIDAPAYFILDDIAQFCSTVAGSFLARRSNSGSSNSLSLPGQTQAQ